MHVNSNARANTNQQIQISKFKAQATALTASATIFDNAAKHNVAALVFKGCLWLLLATVHLREAMLTAGFRGQNTAYIMIAYI